MCPSQQFLEGHFFVFWRGVGGGYHIYFILIYQVLCYQQMHVHEWIEHTVVIERKSKISLFT